MKNLTLSLLALISMGGCGSVGNIFKVFQGPAGPTFHEVSENKLRGYPSQLLCQLARTKQPIDTSAIVSNELQSRSVNCKK